MLITGATGGIGSELGKVYTELGRTLILHGRYITRMEDLVRGYETREARVFGLTFDLRDTDTTVRELRLVSQRESIDLVIVNVLWLSILPPPPLVATHE